MNNQAMQVFLDELKDRTAVIYFDNNAAVPINYKDSPTLDDIRLVTKGGVDFVVVHYRRKVYGVPQKDGEDVMMGWETWHPTECVQYVVVMDEDSKRYGIDMAWIK